MDPAQRRPVDWIHSATTQAQLVRDYVVWDAEPATPAASVADVVRARQRALSAPQGPAYVSLDAGVQEAALDAPLPLPDLALHAPAPRIAPEPDALARAAELLARAERPVVVAGRVGLDARATAPLVELVELLGAAYRDDRNVVAFPTAHPQNATGDAALLRDADVVLAVDVVDLPALLDSRGRGARDEQDDVPAAAAVIDLSHGDLGLRSWSNAFAVPVERSVQLLADPLLALSQLLPAVAKRIDARTADARREAVCQRVGLLRARQWAAVEERWEDTPIAPARMVAETWQAVKDIDHLLCLRNTRTWPQGVWKFSGAGTYLGHSGGGGVGYGPGALVGGALAARDRGQLGVGIVGDGDLLMASAALWTAVHYEIPMLMVVNDNSSFYNDEPHQAEVARHRGRPTENSWIGMRMTDPTIDLAGLARSYGCWATGPITDPAALRPALAEAVAQAQAGAVAVVHVRTAPR
jgi:thiamine pyrophosphate-dependent acetolactate synthase large subunit-like protein